MTATTTAAAKPSRYYYAITWLYGRGVTTDHRRLGVVPCINVHRFPSLKAAKAWTAKGNDYCTGRDYREMLSEANPSVRRFVRTEVRRAATLDAQGYRRDDVSWGGTEREDEGEVLC